MAIPKSFIEENLKKAKGSTIYGVPLEDLTKEELMACVAAGWVREQRAIKEGAERLNILKKYNN
jgi:hypothetical protein